MQNQNSKPAFAAFPESSLGDTIWEVAFGDTPEEALENFAGSEDAWRFLFEGEAEWEDGNECDLVAYGITHDDRGGWITHREAARTRGVVSGDGFILPGGVTK